MTPDFPPALAPWRKWLALFPDELARVLGDLSARIALLVGAMGDRDGSLGAPDGFGGIARRGPYDRLLTSEWLLHDELPDEFMRRVVAGEHAFLERSFRQSAATKRTIALFDAGPSQLGAPRIVQLATLLTLAARAEKHGAELSFGVWQDEGTMLHERVDAASVASFLEARARRHPTAEDATRWAAIASEREWSESWSIGETRPRVASGAPARALGERRVKIAEVLAVDRRAVTIEVAQPDRRARSATLDLPPARACVRMFRDPFGALAGATPTVGRGNMWKLDPSSGFVFTPDGRKLYARTHDGALLTVPIPGFAGGAVPKPRVLHLPLGHRLVAAGQQRAGKRAVALTAEGRSLYVHVASKRARAIHRSRHFVLDAPVFTGAEPLLPLGVLSPDAFAVAGRHAALLHGDTVRTHEVDAAVSVATSEQHLYFALGGGMAEGCLTSFVQFAGDDDILSAGRHMLPARATRPLYLGARADVFVGWREGNDVVLLVDGDIRVLRNVSGNVVGLVERGLPKSEAAAIVLDPDRRTLWFCGDTRERIVTTTSPIVFAAASTAAPMVAYYTELGELGVYSFIAQSVVFRATVGDDS